MSKQTQDNPRAQIGESRAYIENLRRDLGAKNASLILKWKLEGEQRRAQEESKADAFVMPPPLPRREELTPAGMPVVTLEKFGERFRLVGINADGKLAVNLLTGKATDGEAFMLIPAFLRAVHKHKQGKPFAFFRPISQQAGERNKGGKEITQGICKVIGRACDKWLRAQETARLKAAEAAMA